MNWGKKPKRGVGRNQSLKSDLKKRGSSPHCAPKLSQALSRPFPYSVPGGGLVNWRDILSLSTQGICEIRIMDRLDER